jgi:hypothetical protein
MSHSVMGCSNIVKAVVLQGMLAEAGVFGHIVPSYKGYAVKVTHTEDHPACTVTNPPTLEFGDETFTNARVVPPQKLLSVQPRSSSL